jgi:hypothetical protein
LLGGFEPDLVAAEFVIASSKVRKNIQDGRL